MDLDSRHLAQDPEDGQWKRVMFYLHPDHHVRWRFVPLTAYERSKVYVYNDGHADLNIPTQD